MKPKKIELSWIVVSNLREAEKFYTDVIGMKVVERCEEYGWMEVQGREGGARLGIAQASDQEDVPAGSNAVVAITVDNLNSSMAELKKKGVEFLGDILEIPHQVRMISFKDTDGNRFQLVEPSTSHD